MTVPTQGLHQRARRQRLHPEHVTQRQLHRQRRHRAGLRAPQGRILPRPGLADLRELQSRPQRLHHLLEHNKTPSKAQGPDPGRIPRSGPPTSRITATIKRVQVSGRSSTRRTPPNTPTPSNAKSHLSLTSHYAQACAPALSLRQADSSQRPCLRHRCRPRAPPYDRG